MKRRNKCTKQLNTSETNYTYALNINLSNKTFQNIPLPSFSFTYFIQWNTLLVIL